MAARAVTPEEIAMDHLRVTERRSLLQTALFGTVAAIVGGTARAAPPDFAAPVPGAKDAQAITLRFATNYVGVHPMAHAVREVLKAFQADYPNVSINIEETPGNDHQTKIKLDASSDRLPDLFNYWRLDPGFGLDQIARAGKLADLTEWTRADPAFQGLFDEYAWETASLNGKVYGVPLVMFFVEFLANKAVFDRAGVAVPNDWPGLLAAVQALKAKGEIPWAISTGNDSQGGRIYNYVINRSVGNDRALRMHAGKEPINVPEMVKAAELLKQLVVGNVPGDAIAIRNEAVYAKYVNTDRGALIMDGSWVTPTIKPEVQAHLVVLEFPLLPGGAQTQRNVERDLTGLFYVSAKSMRDNERRPYVLELVRRLTSRQAGKIYAEQAQQQVPMLGVEIDEAKIGRVTFEAEKIAMSVPANKWLPAVMKPTQRSKFEPLLGEFLSGKYEPPDFVAQLGQIFGG
jgi:raffinose/stachyose/melibiose transport system substrate-binding protein